MINDDGTVGNRSISHKPHPPVAEMLEVFLRERENGRQPFFSGEWPRIVCATIEDPFGWVPEIKYGYFLAYERVPPYWIS